MNTDTLMTITQVAKFMGVTRQAIYVSIHNKRLPAQKLGEQWFVSPEQIEEYKKTRYSRSCSRGENGQLIFDNSKGKYSIHQLAKLFDVSPQRVYYLVRNKRLKTERVRTAYVIEVEDMEATKKIVLGETI